MGLSRVQVHPVVSLFSDLVSRDDASISLPAAALALAGVHYPDIDLETNLGLLRHLKEVCADQARKLPGTRIEALNHVVFETLGFRGDRDQYYSVRNSLLNDVLERRLGIPITLAVVYLELGEALGLRLEGVSFPAHFLVREIESGQLLDPFSDGAPVDRARCLEITEAIGLAPEDWSDEFLRTASRREILHRMINNLRGAYNRAGDQRRLEVLEEMFAALDSAQTAASFVH
jgi:regulator of sirC expression with transglutaminase-like and TPR domain